MSTTSTRTKNEGEKIQAKRETRKICNREEKNKENIVHRIENADLCNTLDLRRDPLRFKSVRTKEPWLAMPERLFKIFG